MDTYYKRIGEDGLDRVVSSCISFKNRILFRKGRVKERIRDILGDAHDYDSLRYHYSNMWMTKEEKECTLRLSKLYGALEKYLEKKPIGIIYKQKIGK